MKTKLTFSLLFIVLTVGSYSQSSFHIFSERPFPDFVFQGGLGYSLENHGFYNRIQLDYGLKERISLGIACNYLSEKFDEVPQPFRTCGFWGSDAKPNQELIYLSFLSSFHLYSEDKGTRGTFSIGPAFGYHNYPKEFIRKNTGFLFSSSTCYDIVMAKEAFSGLDTHVKVDFLIGTRSGIFLGYNILIIPNKNARSVLQAGYQITIS
jgi:hypothetical protein